MREYKRYTSHIEALQSTDQLPFLMHVGACIDPFYKRRIAMFDLGKSHGDVTETEWVAWFMEAHDEEPAELDALKRRLQIAVQFDTRILDADNGQEWVLHQEGKLVVGIITKAITPAPLQVAVTKQFQLQQNKVLKADVFRFIKWLR
ncbi:hypothetical protein H310_01812 [Aphanomyces invadans]|uniref:Uncharacterized protein n=1 Tax=Aphanomyces invadans TaxID=157072 RepID=A0A024UNN0_9STRA|nr:hypothetical protein H310_01812 [Aphanomyces invadans]ETW07248.1 hypothetical protein H310_01812 [Aphanomyces invadans]|eukprot:XP_008863341.1 hypothetical protein H310_01812 [Aphanomyces invadans]